MLPQMRAHGQNAVLDDTGASCSESATGPPQQEKADEGAQRQSQQRKRSLLGSLQQQPAGSAGTSPARHRDESLVEADPSLGADAAYKVCYTKDAHKKRRKYQDGIVVIKAGKLQLYSEDGKRHNLSKTIRVSEKLPFGREIVVTTEKVIEVLSEIPLEDFVSGQAFAAFTSSSALAPTKSPPPKAKRFRAVTDSAVGKQEVVEEEPSTAPLGALPLAGEREGSVYLEAGLCRHLKPHQAEGVRFMDRHIRGGGGCILADSMGLGKTLQALCLVWAALSRPASKPLCRKAAVVCPTSLCGNWAEECDRWLGRPRVKPTVIQGGLSPVVVQQELRDFVDMGKLLIISYEQLRAHADKVDDVIELLVFDEGHRLKSSAGLTTKRLVAMKCKRRVLLTGTPLQNNLDEFHCCVSFVQPRILPPLPTFQRVFKSAIDRSQDASASVQEVELGRARSTQLAQLTAGIILRRGPELLETLLPPRTELLVTVLLSARQARAYIALCRAVQRSKQLGTSSADQQVHLSVLGLLRQLCNVDPDDLHVGGEGGALPMLAGLVADTPPARDDASSSIRSLVRMARAAADRGGLKLETGGVRSKLVMLEALLAWCQAFAPQDGVVVVSGYMRSLEQCGALCERLQLPSMILTGSTPVGSRVDLINSFNRRSGSRVLLLSSRAGGVGLNIVGANRLVLLEPDWNPAQDLQAMGRIWRHGQKKPCFIYRLAAHGSIEEKVLARQSRKRSLATAALSSKTSEADGLESNTNSADLRQVYNLDGYTHAGVPLSDALGQGLGHLSGGLADADLAGIPEAVGLSGQSVRSTLFGVTVLDSTEGRLSAAPAEIAAAPAEIAAAPAEIA